MIIVQRAVLVTHIDIVLRVIHRHGAVKSDVTDGSFVAAGYAAHAGITIGVLYITYHAAVFYIATRFIQADDAAQVRIFRRMIMVAFDVAGHPAVFYRAVVVAGDATHHSRIAHLDKAVHVKVRHSATGSNRFKESLVVVASIFNPDADGMAVAIELAFIARAPHRFPRRGSHIEVGVQTVCDIVVVYIFGHIRGNHITPVVAYISQFGRRRDDYNKFSIINKFRLCFR